MRRPQGEPVESEWREVRHSNSVWRHVEGKLGVTVFEDPDGNWKWVYDGEFSEAYASMDDAMDAAEWALGL